MTVPELKNLKPFEFQNWVIQQFNGTQARRQSGDMGIDGYSSRHEPIQVKRSERVGRQIIDNFETALARAGRQRDYLLLLASPGVHARRQRGLEQRLTCISRL